jgi:hypothetical protein
LVNSPAGLETRPPATNDRPGKKLVDSGRRAERGLNLLWLLLLLADAAAAGNYRPEHTAQGDSSGTCPSLNVIRFRVGAIHHEGGDRRKDCFSNLVVTNNAALACTFHHRRARQRS